MRISEVAGGRKRLASPRLVGRTEELDRLVDVVSAPPAVVVAEGEAGVGKTRLVAELAGRLHPGHGRLVIGACRRIREPFPLGSVIEALRGLGADLPPSALSPVAGALRPLLPELAGVLPAQPPPLADRAAEQHRVFRALVEVLAAAGPAVLVLEDLHWADGQTVDFLAYLLADPPPKLSVLLTFRGEEVPPGIRAVTATLPATVGWAQVALTPLDVRQTGELTGAILGLDRVSGEFAGYLWERSAGLPFVIEELLALLQAQGSLVRGDSGWVRKRLAELDVPSGVRDPVLERFGRLPAGARAVAEAAAVLQVPVPVPVLVGTCRIPRRARALRAVEQGLESGLLVEAGPPAGSGPPAGPVGFRHLLAAQAVYEAVPGPRRRQLHARAAAALGRLDPVPLGQRAHHLRHAGQPEAWVTAAEQAAEQAIAAGHQDEAARLLAEVLRNASLDPVRRGRLAVRLGLAASQALYADPEVQDLLAGAVTPDLPGPVRGELRLWMAHLVERFGGDIRRQRQLCAEAVTDLADRPELLASAMVYLAMPCVPGVPLAEYRRWLRRILATLPAVTDPGYRVVLLAKVAMVYACLGDPQWRELTDRVDTLTGGAPRGLPALAAYQSIGANACYAGHLAVADRLLVAGIAGAELEENRRRELIMRATQALLDYCRGAWDGLAERTDALLAQLTDHPSGRVDGEVAAGCLALARGDLDRAGAVVEELLPRLERGSSFVDVLSIPAIVRIRLALARGDESGALAGVDRFLTAVESVPLPVAAVRALPVVVQTLAAGGQPDRARALVGKWVRVLRGRDAPMAAAAVPHARGLLAEVAGQWATAARRLRAAAASYRRLGCPYEEAQARELAGSVLLRAGDAGPGGAELREAMLAFQRLGASWDYSRAAGTARRYDLAVPARHRGGRRGYGDRLSPREREVAGLAAHGQSNEQIAAALFVSVKTVEGHLTAVMRKLGVRSRAAIIHRLAGGGASVAAPGTAFNQGFPG